MIEHIAFYLGQRDEEANIRVAQKIADTEDLTGLSEIAAGLGDKDPAIAHDCIKVMYETGARKPLLIADHAELFLRLLRSPDNRMVWGAATALAWIAGLKGDYLYEHFDDIYRAYKKGSVITVDQCISIFAGMAKTPSNHRQRVFAVILDHLTTCRPKEVAQHAERSFVCVDRDLAPAFEAVLRKRYDGLADSQKKRVDRILKKIAQFLPNRNPS